MRTIIVVAVVLAAACLVVPIAPAAAQADPQAQLVSDVRIGGGSNPTHLTRAAGLIFFSADDGDDGRELWATDGTEAGTRLVRDIRPGPAGSRPKWLTRVGDRLFFVATDGAHGRELWVSDGTRAGTRLVKDLAKGGAGAVISGIADGGGTAFFGRDHRSLWRSDGTAAGTRLIRGFSGVALDSARWMGSRLYFSANDALWKTNGTTAGTKRLSPSYWGLDSLTPYRGRIYYRASPPLGEFGGIPQLWWSDGTWAGTARLGTMRDPSYLIVLGDELYFNARRRGTSKPRLYHADGTARGTLPVIPWVRPLWEMARVAGHLWAPGASPGQLGWDQLWVSDGTAAGTRLLRDGDEAWFVYGWDGQGQVGLDGLLWFAATPVGVVNGEPAAVDAEVWSSDATPAETREAVDINADGSSYPREFVRLGDAILFSADDGVHGREVWSIRVP